jgi:hypothetical protein
MKLFIALGLKARARKHITALMMRMEPVGALCPNSAAHSTGERMRSDEIALVRFEKHRSCEKTLHAGDFENNDRH